MRTISRSKALEAAAATLEAEARSLRREAEYLKQRAASRERIKELRGIWKRVTGYIDRGMSEAAARAHTANTLGVGLETVDYWMRRAAVQSAAFKTWRRDREIFRIAHTRSNRELAALYQLHPNTVSRILKSQLNKRHRA